MPNDSEDLMPRNVPKPTPLIEVVAKPLVPEVSLLLDQEKNKSFHLMTPTVENTEGKPGNNYHFNGEKNTGLGLQTSVGMFNVDHFESYNTWRAKNANALHNITGSLGRAEAPSKRSVSSRSSNDDRKKQTKSKEYYHPQGSEVNDATPTVVNQALNTMCSSQVNAPHPESHPNVDNFSRRTSYSVDQQQQHTNHPSNMYNEPFTHSRNYPQPRDNEVNTHMRKMYQFSEPKMQGPNCLPMPVQITHCNIKDAQAQNMHTNTYGMSGPCRPNTEMPVSQPAMPYYYNNNTNKGQCHCKHDQCGVSSTKGMEFANREPKEGQNNNVPVLNGKVESSSNMVQVNNQTVMDLYNIIHMQNEQILMLQNQVKQVLQIHLDCDRNSLKQNLVCRNCSCESKNNEASKSDTCNCRNVEKPSPIERDSVKKNVSSPNSDCNNKPKRSVGIMTSPIEQDDNEPIVHGKVKTNSNTVKSNSKKYKKQRQRQPVYISPSAQKKKSPNQRELPCRQEKRRSQFVSTAQKTNKEEINRGSQLDNSFSLNEAELIKRTDAEQNDDSPNSSAQIDLPDYCNSSSSSIQSDDTASSSNEEDGTESGTGGDSSEPQLGWTFYNQVVGKVNNILKKNPSPHRKEYGHSSRRNLPNHLYDLNGEYDTENNWSKRVTFDGPPPKHRDHIPPHLMYQPRSHPARINPEYDYRPGGPNRMHDFMMYNIADGNSNLSFAALRCQDRYNMMHPPYAGTNMPEHMYQGYLGSTKATNRKFRNPQMPPQSHKKRPGGPSSKLLDLTALKQQPKLF